MKITIIAPGSRGDVQPYVALGTGLRDAGQAVRLLTTQDFEPLVTAAGLEFAGMGDDAEAGARAQFQGVAERGNLLEILTATGRGARQMATQAAASGQRACQDADLLIGGIGGLSLGLALAEQRGIPFMQAYLFPLTPTRAFASVVTPLPQTRLVRWTYRGSHHLARQMMWRMIHAADTAARTKVLGMKPGPFWGPFNALDRTRQSVLYGYSSHVLPRPSDWPDFAHITGYWFLEPAPGWEPPDDLLGFLAAGPPPIYVGFGSMLSQRPEETTRLVVRALALAGQRGVLASGWGGLSQRDLPDTVHMVASIPHGRLFPRMAAVVHHGGAGSTAAGLRAGIPSVITPFFGDQPFWGRCVHELGVGPLPLPRRKLTADGLAAAIRQAVTDRAMRERAAALGARIRAEDGIARAVAIIEQVAPR